MQFWVSQINFSVEFSDESRESETRGFLAEVLMVGMREGGSGEESIFQVCSF